jgi:small nuclear ribonucleoprotein (snRNP)-like protein
MKKLYPIITATSLVFIASLAGYHLPATGDRSPVIPVFIPDNTKVSLKNGTSLSGRLIKFDSQAKTIALGRESKTKEVAMKEIKQIEFQGKVIIRESQSLVISAVEELLNDEQQQNRGRWHEPLQNFKIVDVNEGKAEVTLTSLNPRQIGIISDVLRNSSYVVEEIKFNPSDKIEIQVNRCVATYQYGRCYN